MGMFDNPFGEIGSLVGAGVNYISAQNATNAQTQAADAANQTEQKNYDKIAADEAPYLAAGTKALGDLQTQMPDLTRRFTSSDFQADPAYQFDLNQGMQAMSRSAAAKGILNSTGTLQNLNNYAQGMASNEYSNAYNRFTNNQTQRYNMYSGIAGMGDKANNTMATVGMNTANNIGSNQLGAGNAIAAGNIAEGNAINSGIGAFSNNNMMNKYMNQMSPGGGGSGSPSSYNGLNTTGDSNGFTMPELGSQASGGAGMYSLLY